MNRRRSILLVAALALAGTGWYLFRPERLWVNTSVSEGLPTAASAGGHDVNGPAVLASGMFHSVAHDGRGAVSVLRLADGRRVLRFADFETSNGPDVQVYLGKALDAADNATVTDAGFFHVGALKGNVGDQNYDLPPDLNLDEYHSVTVWCRRFGVNFATAPLTLDRADTMARTLVTGSFHSVHHDGTGMATVLDLGGGRRVLRLSEFETSNGPELHLYLVAAPDAMDNDTVTQAGFVDLGPIKGNVGDQNYTLPDGVDLGRYRAVTVWCKRFGVNFTTAPLGA